MIMKYIASRAIALSLPGVPGIYINGLFGIENDLEGCKKTKHNRDINRKRLKYSQVDMNSMQATGRSSKIYRKYISLLKSRKASSES